jgi:mannose-6-phosphate isomerase-like protein (cupin superfamily)
MIERVGQRSAMAHKSSYSLIRAYVTKDGSEIRELMHPAVHGICNLSLAEAIVRPGTETRLHRHRRTEEIYHVTAGTGLMTLGDQMFSVTAGDSVCIPPGSPHCIRNTGDLDLRILCCCAPAYSHEDTELL